MAKHACKSRLRSITLSVALALSSGVTFADVPQSASLLTQQPSAAAMNTQNSGFLGALVPLFTLGMPSTDSTSGSTGTTTLGSGLNTSRPSGLGLRPVFAGNLGDGKTLVLFQNEQGQFFASVIPLYTQTPQNDGATGTSGLALGQGLTLTQPSSESAGLAGGGATGSAQGAQTVLSTGGAAVSSGLGDSRPVTTASTDVSSQRATSSAGSGSSMAVPAQASVSGSAQGRETSGSALGQAENSMQPAGSASTGMQAAMPASSSSSATVPVASSSETTSNVVSSTSSGSASSDESSALQALSSVSQPASGFMGVTEAPTNDNNPASAPAATVESASEPELAPVASSSSSSPANAGLASSTSTETSAGSAATESTTAGGNYKPSDSSSYMTKPVSKPVATAASSDAVSADSTGSGGGGSSLAPSGGFLSGVSSSYGTSSSSPGNSILDNMSSSLAKINENATSGLQDRAENYHNYSSADPAADAVCASPQAMIRNQQEGDGYLANVNPSWTWSHAGHANSALGGWEHWSKDEQARLPQFKGLAGSWQRLMPWFVILRLSGSHEAAEIEIGRMSVYWFSREDLQWHLIAFDMKPEIGVCGPEDAAMVNCRSPGTEPLATTGTHNALHGWFEFVEIPETVLALNVVVQARKLRGGPALMTVAADYYPPEQSNLKGVPITGAAGSAPRRLKDNGDWTIVTMTTLADQTVDDTGISREQLMQRYPRCTSPAADT